LALDNNLPVKTIEDVLDVMPTFVRESEHAPIRDAFAAAALEMFKAYQERMVYASAQSDTTKASNIYLDGLAKDHEIYRQLGETNASVRSRIFEAPDQVTPASIMAAVSAIVSPYTEILPQYCESELDCLFISDGTAVWDSFIGANPMYLDRLHPEYETENGGYVRPQSNPGGAWVFNDNNGRFFVIRVPVLEGADDEFAFIGDSDDDSFIFTGTGSSYDTFIYVDSLTSDELYDAIVAVVNGLKGQGIRWILYVDPELVE